MRILLVRHGESEGNVDASVYTRKGDKDVALTSQGWQQAIKAGQFLAKHYKASATPTWPTTYVSSYRRPKETMSGLLHGMQGVFPGAPKLFEDPRLVEKFFGAASVLEHPPKDMPAELIAGLMQISKRVYGLDPFVAKNLFGESTKDILITVKNFIDGTLNRAMQVGRDDFLIVTHGAIIQAFIMSWAHAQMAHKNRIGNPGNCDIIEISGVPQNWSITKIYDGEKGISVHEDIRARITPFTADDLPAVPEDLRIA